MWKLVTSLFPKIFDRTNLGILIAKEIKSFKLLITKLVSTRLPFLLVIFLVTLSLISGILLRPLIRDSYNGFKSGDFFTDCKTNKEFSIAPPEQNFVNSGFSLTTYRYFNQYKEAENFFLDNDSTVVGSRSSYKILPTDQDKNRKFFQELVGTIPPEGEVKMISEVEITEKNEITLSRVKFHSRIEGITVEGILAVPKFSNSHERSAVVSLHGMTSSPEKLFGLDECPDYSKSFGLELAKKGYIVFAPFNFNHSGAMDELDALAGRSNDSLIRVSIAKVISSIDYLEQKKEIENVGLYGISWGGWLAYWTGAYDERPKAVVSSGYFRDFENLYNKVDYNATYNIFALRSPVWAFFDNAQIGGLIADRPLLIENGKKDTSVQKYCPECEFEQLEKIYDSLGAKDKIKLSIFDGYHEIDLDSISWIERWLD